jgi:2TM domain
MPAMIDDTRFNKAKREVAALKGLFVHAVVYVCVISGLIVLNLLLPKSGWWVQWPLLGWGIGLLVHGFLVFSPIHLFDRDWEERKIKERLERK